MWYNKKKWFIFHIGESPEPQHWFGMSRDIGSDQQRRNQKMALVNRAAPCCSPKGTLTTGNGLQLTGQRLLLLKGRRSMGGQEKWGAWSTQMESGCITQASKWKDLFDKLALKIVAMQW